MTARGLFGFLEPTMREWVYFQLSSSLAEEYIVLKPKLEFHINSLREDPNARFKKMAKRAAPRCQRFASPLHTLADTLPAATSC